jgi:hypothetical protein
MRILRRLFGYACLLGLAIILNGCGGRAINKKLARAAIVRSPADALAQSDVEVLSVTQVGAREAVATTNLRAAFRIEKVGGTWVVREVRVGKGDWEKLDNILLALERIKIEDTRRMLEIIGDAIAAYTAKNGRLPPCKDYVELSDALYPGYLSPLIRHDAWSRPLAAHLVGSDTVRLLSAGPDGKPGTPDDVELARTYVLRNHPRY